MTLLFRTTQLISRFKILGFVQSVTLYSGNGTDGNVCSNTLISNITGSSANIAKPFIETISDSKGGICAGIRIFNCNVFNEDVPVPDQLAPKSKSLAQLGRHFISVNGKFDTLYVKNNICNRFDAGLEFNANVQSASVSIAKVIDNYFDFCKSAGILIRNGPATLIT